MAAIYKAGVILTIPKYDLGHPNNAANVIAWSTTAVGLTLAQLAAVQLAFDTAWSTQWKTFASSTNRYMGCWVIDMASATGNQVTNSAYTPVPGAASALSWSDNTAALISLKTQTRYRGGHGRIYVPGLNSGALANDGQTLLAAVVTSMAAMWDNTATAMSAVAGSAGGPYLPIVWHKHLSSSPNSVENVVGRTVQTTIATQRRRLRKVTRRRRR